MRSVRFWDGVNSSYNDVPSTLPDIVISNGTYYILHPTMDSNNEPYYYIANGVYLGS